MARGKGRRSKLLTITLGCFSVILLIVAVSGIVVVWAGLSYRSLGAPTADDAVRTIAVSDNGILRTIKVSPPDATDPAAVPPPGTDLDTLSPSEFPGIAANREPIRLDIAFAEGRFKILPGPPGSDITVEGNYSSNYYDLVEEHSDDDDGREIFLQLVPKASYITRVIAGLTVINKQHPNDLTIYIPPDIPIDLNINLSIGHTRVELGGLTLTDLDVDLSKGDFKLSFKEPLAAPLPRMAVAMGMGDGRISGLGNARTGDITLDTGMGGFRVSLNGDWPANSDSQVKIDHSMGDLTLTIPAEVHIADDSSSLVMFGGSQGRLKDSEKYPVAADAATLHLDVNTSMGSVNVRRIRSSSSDDG